MDGWIYKGVISSLSSFLHQTHTLTSITHTTKTQHTTLAHAPPPHKPQNVQVYRCHLPRFGVDRLCCPRTRFRTRLCRACQAIIRYWYLVRAERKPRTLRLVEVVSVVVLLFSVPLRFSTSPPGPTTILLTDHMPSSCADRPPSLVTTLTPQ